MKEVTMEWAAAHADEINLVDVRSPEEFAERSVPGAKNFPMIPLTANPQDFLDKSKTYHLMCRSGGRSGRTTANLEAQGYDVVNVAGGILAYKK